MSGSNVLFVTITLTAVICCGSVMIVTLTAAMSGSDVTIVTVTLASVICCGESQL